MPIALMRLYCFIFEQSADDRNRVLSVRTDLAARLRKGRVLRIIAREFEQSMFRQPVDDPANTCPVRCARAHHAWLRAGVQGRLIYPVSTQHMPPGRGCDYLRVPRCLKLQIWLERPCCEIAS